MGRPRSFEAAACAAVLLAVPTSTEGQSDREQWLEGCRRSSTPQRVRHCEVRDVPTQTVGRLEVDPGRNGGMSISGSDRSQVSVEARIQTEASTLEEARARARALTIRSSNGTIRADFPAGESSSSVIFVISAPHRTNVIAKAQNGPVAISAIEGEVSANVVNGPLALRDLAGDVRAHTVNGPLSVTLGGSGWRGRGIEATAENGPVILTMPESYAADLTTGTVNGPLIINFPLIREPSRNQRMIKTRIGSGGPQVHVTTVNGPAVVRVRNDQRTRTM